MQLIPESYRHVCSPRPAHKFKLFFDSKIVIETEDSPAGPCGGDPLKRANFDPVRQGLIVCEKAADPARQLKQSYRSFYARTDHQTAPLLVPELRAITEISEQLQIGGEDPSRIVVQPKLFADAVILRAQVDLSAEVLDGAKSAPDDQTDAR